MSCNTDFHSPNEYFQAQREIISDRFSGVNSLGDSLYNTLSVVSNV